LKPVLEDPELAKGGQNIKYDWILLRRTGINLSGVVFDTMVESYLIDPARRTHNLSQIASEYLDHEMISYKKVTDNGKIAFQDVPVEDATVYACEDAGICLMAHHVLMPR
jgi:DNA polymerase-1